MVPVDQNDNSQPYSSFRCSYGYHKNRKYLSGEQGGCDEFGEGDEIDINRIEHQLNSHQDPDGISSGNGTIDTDTE
jgi:hypothetical protein